MLLEDNQFPNFNNIFTHELELFIPFFIIHTLNPFDIFKVKIVDGKASILSYASRQDLETEENAQIIKNQGGDGCTVLFDNKDKKVIYNYTKQSIYVSLYYPESLEYPDGFFLLKSGNNIKKINASDELFSILLFLNDLYFGRIISTGITPSGLEFIKKIYRFKYKLPPSLNYYSRTDTVINEIVERLSKTDTILGIRMDTFVKSYLRKEEKIKGLFTFDDILENIYPVVWTKISFKNYVNILPKEITSIYANKNLYVYLKKGTLESRVKEIEKELVAFGIDKDKLYSREESIHEVLT